jgi:hypothetical protein
MAKWPKNNLQIHFTSSQWIKRMMNSAPEMVILSLVVMECWICFWLEGVRRFESSVTCVGSSRDSLLSSDSLEGVRDFWLSSWVFGRMAVFRKGFNPFNNQSAGHTTIFYWDEICSLWTRLSDGFFGGRTKVLGISKSVQSKEEHSIQKIAAIQSKHSTINRRSIVRASASSKIPFWIRRSPSKSIALFL